MAHEKVISDIIQRIEDAANTHKENFSEEVKSILKSLVDTGGIIEVLVEIGERLLNQLESRPFWMSAFRKKAIKEVIDSLGEKALEAQKSQNSL